MCLYQGSSNSLGVSKELDTWSIKGIDSDRVLACDFPRPYHFRWGSSSQSVDCKNNSQLRYLTYPCSFAYLRALKVNMYRKVEMDNIYINHAL